MRALVRMMLVNALPVGSDLPAERWYGSGSILDTPIRPFAEIRFGGKFQGMGSVTRRRLEVWIHNEEGDYESIEDWIRFAQSVLDGAEHVTDGVGNEVISCSWVNNSTDLYDDGYRTNCMSATFELVGKEVS